MSEEIIIPGYKALVPNIVWARGIGSKKYYNYLTQKEEELPTSDVLAISKAIILSGKDIFSYLQELAKKYLGNKGEKDEIFGLFMELPREKLEKIVEGEEKTKEHFEKHFNENYLTNPRSAGRRFINIANPQLPDSIINALKKQNETDYFHYSAVMQQAKINSLIAIRVDEDDSVESSKLEFLLEAGVITSDFLVVVEKGIDYEEIKTKLRFLNSHILSYPKKIKLLLDVTDERRRNIAYSLLG